MDILLYGLNSSGVTEFSEVLRPQHRRELRNLAEARLDRCHAVEVWEGPMCILRLRRQDATPSPQDV